jgi:hypothetical protein
MLLAAAARGWQLTYFEQSDLFLRDGVALGRGRPLQVFANPEKWFQLGEQAEMKLGDFDVVFMRKDPPFDAEYIYTTYILERAELQGAFVANRPQGLRDMNEKVFTAWFPQCCAPTLITRAASDIRAFTHTTLDYPISGRFQHVRLEYRDQLFTTTVVIEPHERERSVASNQRLLVVHEFQECVVKLGRRVIETHQPRHRQSELRLRIAAECD